MIEFLLLDYNREEETRLCVNSIKQNAQCDHIVRLLHNEPFRYYHAELKEQGLIDELHCNDMNLGCGLATMQLFGMCKTEYAIYVQVDQFLQQVITDNTIDKFINAIETNEEVKYIDLAGNQGNGIFSERAAFIPVDWYNSIPKSIGGPGPWAHIKWTEECVQNYMKDRNEKFYSTQMFGNNGKYSMRKNPDGSEWMHETDTKKLKLLKGPVKEKYVYPKFTDEEWETVLKTQEWPDNKIPDQEKAHSFVAWR